VFGSNVSRSIGRGRRPPMPMTGVPAALAYRLKAPQPRFRVARSEGGSSVFYTLTLSRFGVEQCSL
jgi:hypothetical protein